jgi:hypothetical protein
MAAVEVVEVMRYIKAAPVVISTEAGKYQGA